MHLASHFNNARYASREGGRDGKQTGATNQIRQGNQAAAMH
jgi:hypothetical protein